MRNILAKFLCATITFLWVCGPAESAAWTSAVYCEHDPDGLKIFSGRIQANGNLLFGISIWDLAGHNIGVFGTATRQGTHWLYSNNMNATAAEDRCKLDIVLDANGSPRLNAGPIPNCESRGGVGTEIGTVQFVPSAYEGAVTFELSDPETFFGRAGKCAKVGS